MPKIANKKNGCHHLSHSCNFIYDSNDSYLFNPTSLSVSLTDGIFNKVSLRAEGVVISILKTKLLRFHLAMTIST
ncbi:MAG: hypothetical protein AB1349_03920 [Elusimicrobiota bacterium]